MYDPSHPGEILEDGWLAGRLSLAEAAAELGVPRKRLERCVSGAERLDAALAVCLEAAGWSSADFWMRLQAAYDLAQERQVRERAAA